MKFFKRKFVNSTTDYEPLEDESENEDFNIEDNSENNENLEQERQGVSVNFQVNAFF